MIVQWAIKGISGGPNGINDNEARSIINDGQGIICNWWRNQHQISPPEVRMKLNYQNLLRHVNQYDTIDPQTGKPFYMGTPFISLASGCVERTNALRTNRVIPAKRTALEFATEWGTVPGYLFYCWVILGLNQAVEIESVAEEVRNLNTYRSYSPYQTEGEITAKIQICSNQILKCEKYEHQAGRALTKVWTHDNAKFENPSKVSNIRELF
jgi:hypothetical protein